MIADVLWKTIFLILKPYRRWSPMIADAPKVFINRNSSTMDRRLSAMNYDLKKTRLYLNFLRGVLFVFPGWFSWFLVTFPTRYGISVVKHRSYLKNSPGGALDQILVGDVPSRLQKHTRSLYQFLEKIYPTLYQFFEKVSPTLCISYKNLEKRYRFLYQNCEN